MRRTIQATVSPNSPAQSRTSRQQAWRHAEHSAETFIPLAAADIEQQRARGIAGVGGVHLAAGEPPQQESSRWCRRRAGRLPPSRARPPRDRAARRSCWRKNTDRAAARSWRRSPARGLAAQRIAKIRRAPVLPDDRVVDRLAGRAIPDHGGFALIGDADAGDVARAETGLAPSPRARWRPRPARSPPDRARPSPAPDKSGAAPAARWRAA